MKIHIPANSTIFNCEKALAKLHKSDSAPDCVVMPTNFKFKSLGAEISWIQCLVTWVKKYNSLKIVTDAGESKERQVEKFTKQLIGTIASLCATDIRSNKDDTSLTDTYKMHALERLDDLQKPRLSYYSKGPNVDFVAEDNFARNTPACLYPNFVDGRPVLGGRVHFMSIAKWLTDSIVPTDETINDYTQTREVIGTLLYEAYRNTEDHSKFDIDGNWTEHSYRIMQSAYSGNQPNNLATMAEGFEPLQEYFKTYRSTSGKKQATFISLSILDSGPGFAQSLTSTPLHKLDRNEEFEATRACFSSQTRKKRPEYGIGLELVRKYLHLQKGFLRLRTGRLSLYYDSTIDDNVEADIPLKAWKLKQLNSLPQVEGSLLTMYVPVGDTR